MTSLTHLPPALMELASGTSFEPLLKKMQEECDNVSLIAVQYDFNKNSPYNGLRTLLKIVQEYFYEVHAFLLVLNNNSTIKIESVEFPTDLLNDENNNQVKNSEDTNFIYSSYLRLIQPPKSPLTEHLTRLSTVPKNRYHKIYKDLIAIGKYFLFHFEVFVKLQHQSRISGEEEEFSDGIYLPKNYQIIMREFFAIKFEDIGCFENEDILFFWMPKFRRKVFVVLRNLATFWLNPKRITFGYFSTPDTRARANFHTCFSQQLENLLGLVSIVDNRYTRSLIHWSISYFHSCQFIHIQVKRQKRYGFDPSTGDLSFTYAPTISNQSERVNCLYIHNGVKKSDESIIFHLYGSGFSAFNSDFHSSYVADWVKRLNIPVIMPDYSKSPKYPFPHAIQDILDAYLFITDKSNADLVEKSLGFIPRKILLLGDSAGGNLALALTVAINEMNKKRKLNNEDDFFPLPVAMAMAYPATSPIVIDSFSVHLSIFDPFLVPSVLLNCGLGYLIPECVLNKPKSWFRESFENVRSILGKALKFNSNPFVSPLCYKHIDEINDIPMLIIVGEWDVLLDESIKLAKNWKGLVDIEIFPGEIHGFLVVPSAPETSKRKEKLFNFMAKHLS